MANEIDWTGSGPAPRVKAKPNRAKSGRAKSAKARRRARAPDQTREALLRAAVAEFAREGYGGARVERISKAAKSNDRMLYYYFKSKEKLFHEVIEHCYADLVAREEALDLDLSRPREALAALIAFNWNYYWEHPELLSILASENLFKGRHVKNNIRRSFSNTQLGVLDRVLASGVERGEFRSDCDRFHLYLSILSLTYFYRANLYTLSSYMQIDLAEEERRNAWLAHVQAMIGQLVLVE
ncbi:MAG TPA: TetR/AcrR family transcriptional regulator [Bradyrhizobium sp.]|uniref:TetR/AcrR family transcriptional regulator n=1 Tax=Bradyrhizobium sp. TaxID=376 RepID=UPI002CB9C355|nr:TetR/AcrR family transcriptional regulator [Bradyrhizobium sp.]HLZ06517.1 TetR/AcrR family transcriptional regulator [Bradyrhizobium sp.]